MKHSAKWTMWRMGTRHTHTHAAIRTHADRRKVWVGGENLGGGEGCAGGLGGIDRKGQRSGGGNEPNGSYPSSSSSSSTDTQPSIHPSTTPVPTHTHTHTGSVHYLFSSHRLNLALLHSRLGHTRRHALAASSLELRRECKQRPMSVDALPA